MTERDEIFRQIRELVDEYRLDCLWYLRRDYYPESHAQALKALDRIQRYGNVDAFKRAGKLRNWLLQQSSVESVS